MFILRDFYNAISYGIIICRSSIGKIILPGCRQRISINISTINIWTRIELSCSYCIIQYCLISSRHKTSRRLCGFCIGNSNCPVRYAGNVTSGITCNLGNSHRATKSGSLIGSWFAGARGVSRMDVLSIVVRKCNS